MSEIAEAAHVAVFVTDYANVDAANKVNVVGAGWVYTPSNGAGVPAQTVLAIVTIPSEFVGQEAAISLGLYDSTGAVFKPPLPPLPPGVIAPEPAAVRMAQIATVEQPKLPTGASLPSAIPAQMRLVVTLGEGLPLAPGEVYTWRVDIDSTSKAGWSAPFYVVPPPAQPVIG